MRWAYQISLLIFCFCLIGSRCALASFSFQAGDYYGTNETNTIYEYDINGVPDGSLTLTTTDGLRGLAFGPDGLLYVVEPAAGLNQATSVIAIDSSGNIQATYTLDGFYVQNSTSFGNITFDKQGNFYVGGNNGFARFTIGNTSSGTAIYNATQQQGIFDMALLPNGNLLAAGNSALYQMNSSGTFLQTYNIGGSYFFEELRGVGYDPVNNTILANQLGYTGFFYQFMDLDATTGNLISSTTVTYGQDIIESENGLIVVNSQEQLPVFFSQDFEQVGTFGGTVFPYFLTELPEPSVWCVFLIVGSYLLLRRRLRLEVR